MTVYTKRCNVNRDYTAYEPLARFFNAVFNEAYASSESAEEMTVRPAMDVKETENSVIVSLVMPGVDPDKIDISVENEVFIVKTDAVKDEEEKEGEKYLLKELRSFSYFRKFSLPVKVVADKAEASYTNGILSLELPKQAETHPKSIKVKLSDYPQSFLDR